METMKSMTRNADDETDIEVDDDYYDEVATACEQQPNNSITIATTIDDASISAATAATDTASQCDMLAKPAFTSRLLQNIPVRPRKGIVPHLDNYCLFDPSTDFVNEKELKRKQKQLLEDSNAEQLMNDKLYDKLDDIQEETECGNYVIVDPETPSPSDDLNGTGAIGTAYVSLSPRVRSINKTASVNSFMAFGGNRMPATAHKTMTSKIESKIEKLLRQSSLPTVALHGVAESTPSTSLQRELMAKHMPPKHLPLRNGVTPHSRLTFDAMKHSVSSPQLNNAKDRRHKLHSTVEPIYMLYNSQAHSMSANRTMQTMAGAKKRYAQQQRPLSSHSDADSGFLSPITPCETSVAMQQQHPHPTSATSTSTTTVQLHQQQPPPQQQQQQCDNLQQYITVSLSVSDTFRFVGVEMKGCRPYAFS